MQEQDTSRRRKFYDQMSEAYDLGTFEEFDEKMNNPESRRKLHDFIDKDGKYDIGDFAYFDEAMRPVESSAPQEPVTRNPQRPVDNSQNTTGFPQPTDAVGNVLTNNGQPYSEEVLKRYNSPDNKAGNFKDLSQIAKEVEREQMGPTDPALEEGAKIGAGLGMIAAMQQKQQQPQQQDNPFSAENPSMMQPKPAEMPLMFKDVRQQSQNPELNKQWVNGKAAEEAIPADTNADFGQRVATLEKAGNAEAARLMNRKEFDQRNFDKFYKGHVAPVFGEERAAGEKKVQEELAKSKKEDETAGTFNIPTGHTGFAKAFETSVAKEKYTDPKKIADATLKRVQDDNGAGGFGDYVLSRMGINGVTGEDDGSQPQLSEREKEWMKRLFAKETDEVASMIIDRIYDQYKQENAPKSVLEYIGGKALHENMVSSLYDALVRRAAGSSEARAQLRAMAYEDFGKDQGWLARVAGGAAPFAVDMIAGGFALPNIVGKAVVKGGTKLAAREVTKQMERRAAARGLEDAALKEAVKGGEEVAQRYLATQAPILNLAINAAGSAANFATYDVQTEAIRQIANGEFKPVDIMKAAGHGAALGGVMGAAGGTIANVTRNSGLLGKIAGDVAGLGAETAIFGLSSGLQKAIDEGIDIADVDWADTAGEAFGTVVGMKTVGAVMHPKNFLDRYRKSKDYDLKLNQRDLDELKAAGYDLDGIFKGLGKFGEIKPMEGNTIGKAREITIGNYGKEAKTEEAWVDADNYKAILENPEISTSAKRKIVYLATGKVLTPEPVFGATLNVDEDGHATITTTNAYGAPIETKDYKTEEEAQKDYEKLQQISRTNTVGGLERVAQVAGMPIVVDEAKGRTKNETGVDVDDLDQMSDLDDAHFNTVMDVFTKNLQDAYMEHFNERLKKFGETKEDTRPTGNGGDAGGTGSEPVGGSGTTGGVVNPADETGGESTPPPAGSTDGDGTPPTQERTERRDAAYNRGTAVAENEADLPAIGQSARLATARMMQQMPDDNPQLAKVRNSIMQAVEAGNDEEADRLISESNLTAQQQEAVEQWRDAIEMENGINDAVTDQTAQFEEQRRAQLETISDPQGNVTQLQLKDGTTAYYKSGDLDNHFGGVMAVTEDGQTVQLPVRDIANIGQPMNVDDILAGEVEQYAADLTDRYQAMFDGTMLTAGQQVDMVMANQSFTATVVGTDPAGNVIFQMEDGSQMPMRPEDAQAAIQGADNIKIQQQLQAEAEAARLAEQQERFTNSIQGYAEGQPDLTAAGTDAKAAAEYLKEQFAASGQDPEKARKQYLTDIQNTKEQLKRREDEAIDESYRLRQWLTGNEDIADPSEVEHAKQRIAELENAINDIRQRQQKYGDIRRKLMNADELNKMEQERRKVIFKARSGYQPTLPQRNLSTNEERVTMEDGQPNLGLTPVSNANNYLLNHFQGSTDAEQFVNEQRLALRNRQRDEVQPQINLRNDVLNAYASGHLELTPDEVEIYVQQVADFEAEQDALSKEAIRLREIADGISALYERNGREEQLTPAEQRGKALDKAASKDDKLRIARTLYNIYPEALDIINDQEPRDLEEFIADNLGLNSMNWEGYDMGERHIAGVQEAVFGKKGATRGIGKGYTTNAFNQYLAPTGEGKGFDEIVHGIYESQPDIGDGKRWTTEDISNALQDMLRTAQKPSDISHRIIDNRIAEAEDIVQRQEELDREAEEEAKYQELQQWAEAHHLNPDEVEAYQDYLAEKPWEFDEEVINQIIADDEAKSNQSGKEMDSQHPDGSVGSEGEGGESQVPEISPAEGTAENPTVAGQPGAEGGTGGETLPDNNVPGRAPNGAIEDVTKGEDLMHVSFAQRLKAAKAETNPNPTEAQKEAGNYKMGHIRFGGYQMSIENPKGSTRSGVDRNGKPWSIEMQDTYGYIGKKYGTDGDHLDFFINDEADLDTFDGRVYVVDQKNEDGTFDEHKVMYGYPNWSAAKKAYSRNYEPGWWDKHVIQMTGVRKDTFDKWLAESDHKTKPFAEYYRTKRTKDAVSDPIDQLRTDIMERQQKGEFLSLEPSYSEKDLSQRTLDDLKQLRKKRRNDISTSKVLLGTTEIEPGSKKETTLRRNIAQAELDVRIIDKEIQKREQQQKQMFDNMETGGAMVEHLQDMGVGVTDDLSEMRKARKQGEADNSEEGRLRKMSTSDGKVYGFAYRGKLYLDPRKIDANLPLHEYGHLWCEAFRRLNPEEWKDIVGVMKQDADTWQFVKSLNPDLTNDDDIAEEVISKGSGENGQQRIMQEFERMSQKDPSYKGKWGNIWKNISKAIQDFWKKVGDFLHIKYDTPQQVYDQVLKDFANGVNPRKKVEEYLRQRDADYMKAAESGDVKRATQIFNEALKENIGNGMTPYVSVDNYRKLQQLARKVKKGDPAAIERAAELMSPLIPENAVLIPAPSHEGKATDMLQLTNALAEKTGSEVADILVSEPRKSQYEAKKQGGKAAASGDLGIRQEGKLPKGKVPVVIDNVVDSGNTAEACVRALGTGIVASLADSADKNAHASTLKSAQPIVTDKDGNIIPLSQRFDLSRKYLGKKADGLDQVLDEIGRRNEAAEELKGEEEVQAAIDIFEEDTLTPAQVAVRERSTKAVIKVLDDAKVPIRQVSQEEADQMMELFTAMNQKAIADYARQMRDSDRQRYAVINVRDPYAVPNYFEKKKYAEEYRQWGNRMGGLFQTLDLDKSQQQADNIKQAAGIHQQIDFMFDDGAEPKPVFVSNAMKAVEAISQEKATPDQWLAMLQKNGGLKAGEDKWLGLSDWLNEQKEAGKKSVTKQEVEDYIRQNQIQVEEETYKEYFDLDNNPKMMEFRKEFDKLVDKYENERIAVQDESNTFNQKMDDKYGVGWHYKLDEADKKRDEELSERYRKLNDNDPQELAFQDMVDKYGDDFEMAFEVNYGNGKLDAQMDMYGDGLSDAARHYLEFEEQPINSTRLSYTTEGLGNKKEIALTVPTIEPYNESDEIHFGDAGGGRAVAWVRFGETTDADGNKILVIDEIQSKRHQDGRSKGYEDKHLQELYKRAEEAQNEYYKFMRDKQKEYGYDLWDLTDDAREKFGSKSFDYNSVKKEDLQKERELHQASLQAYKDLEAYRETVGDKTNGVPDAPFEKNRHELAMKRMLRYAAENGYDKIAWTTGEQQADRYDLSRQIDEIQSIRNGGGYQVSAMKDGKAVFENWYDSESKLAEDFGKDIANKVFSNQEVGNKQSFKGLDLKVGGEGMAGFYDQILPRFMDKYGKKWGVKTSEIELPQLEESARKMHSIDVTPEMKESVMQGQPMFQKGTGGRIYGWTDGKKIFLAPIGMNPNSPMHEYTHIWDMYIEKHDPQLWKEMVRTFKQTAAWKEIRENPNYRNIWEDENRMASEVHSRLTGARSQEEFEKAAADPNNKDTESIIEAVRDVLRRFWEKIAGLFGHGRDRLEEFVLMPLRDALKGFNPITGDETFDPTAMIVQMSRLDKYGLNESDPRGKAVSEIKKQGGSGVLAGYADKKTGDYVLLGDDARRMQTLGGKGVMTKENGMDALRMTSRQFDDVSPVLVHKGYRIAIADLEATERQPRRSETKSEPQDNTRLSGLMRGREERDADYLQTLIGQQKEYIAQLQKAIPKEQGLYDAWQKAIGTKDEDTARSRYEKYYDNHEADIRLLDSARLQLDDLEKELARKQEKAPSAEVRLKVDRRPPVQSLIQGELFSDKDFEPLPEKKKEEKPAKSTKAEQPANMSDENLLKAIGETDGKQRRKYIDAYDQRHLQEQNEENDSYYDMLDSSETTLEDAYGMYDSVFRQFKDGGYASPERTKLLAQIDALESYIEWQEEREAERRMEEEEEAEAAQQDTVPDEARQKFEQQQKEVRPIGFDLTQMRLRHLEEGETCHVERRYVENGTFSFTGKERIESIDDVAYIFKQLEDAAVENTFLVLEKDGVPTIIHLATGLYTASYAKADPALAAYNELQPDKVYFIHNHPSGNLKCSKADEDVLRSMKKIFGDKLQPGIIIDTKSGKYGLFGMGIPVSPSTQNKMPEKVEGEVPMKVYSFSRQVFDQGWNPETAFDAGTASKVAQFVSSHRLGDHKKTSLLVMTQNWKVTGNVFLPWTTLKEAVTAEAADLIARYMNQMGGTIVTLYGDYDFNDADKENLQELKSMLQDRGVYLADVVHVEGNNYKSAHEMGMVGEPGADKPQGDEGKMYRHTTPEIEKANARFNQELDRQINDPAFPKDHVYKLGKPGVILLSTGFPNDNIELSASHLLEKSKKTQHPFDLQDVKNLVKAINNPVAVFSYGDKDKSQNVIVEMQKNGKNFMVGIHFKQGYRGNVISDIRGIFPRDNSDWINWITQEKHLYLDKEKIQNLIAQQRKILAEVGHLDLNSVAKLIKDFNNPKLSEENLRKIFPTYVVAAEETADMLGGVKVVFESEATEKGTLGWYDPNNNTVHVVLPEHSDANEVRRTVCHEKLGHEGLVALLGSQDEVDKFGQFVFKSAGKSLRQRIIDKANENDPGWKDHLRFSHAAQEVVADIAEEGPRTAEEFSLWDKIKHYLIRFLNKMGWRIRGLINDHDLAYYILKTGEALKKWNQMPESDRTAASRQATEYDIMRARRGKPRKRNDESMAQYLQRLREWEKWKIAEERARENNDPMPDAEQINERWHEQFKQDVAEWRMRNGIPADAEGLGAFPRREAGEAPQDYAARVADYETQKDAWADAPKVFDYLQRANEEYQRLYREWKERYGLAEAANVDLGLYEGDPESLPHIVDPEDLEADMRAEADLVEAVGIDMSREGARRHAKLSLIERRKNLESSNAEDAVWIHDIVNSINMEAYRQGVDPKQLREAMADIIEGTYFEDVIKDDAGNVIAVEDISDRLPIKMTTGLRDILATIKDWYDEFYHVIEDAGLRNDAGYIEEGYVNHVWSKEKSSPEAWKKYVENFQRTKSPNMRERMFKTYRDGRDVGLVPKFSDIADILAYYSVSNNEAVANKKFLDDLSFIVVEEQNGDGEVVSVLPLLNSSKPNIAVSDRYQMYHVPGVGDVYVLKDIQRTFANVFGTMRTQDIPEWLSKTGKVYDTVSSTAKKIELSFSAFHMGALTEVAMAQMRPDRALRALAQYIIFDCAKAGTVPAYAHPEDFKLAASHLVQLGATQDYSAADVNNVTEKLRDLVREMADSEQVAKKGAGYAATPVAYALDMVNKGMDKVLWNYLHDGLKIACFKMFAEQVEKRVEKQGLSAEQREQLLDEAGQYVNDTFGGQYWELLNVSPALIKWLRRGFLSPDWLVSTQRHFLANFGFGSIYSESGFLNYLRYNRDNIKRAFGIDIPRDENRRFRSKNAKQCYLLGVCAFFYVMMNALNAMFRAWDEDKEKEKADEARRDNTGYQSPYELAYPDGMKWYDYTMYGNTIGQQTHLFLGRYDDGTEWYARWGKQFREFPELFMGRHGVEFPTPLMERMSGKANPIGRYLLYDLPLTVGMYGYKQPRETQEIAEKYGNTVALLAMTAKKFLPYSVPTQQDKEFKMFDLVMPSQKGFTRWKAVDYFKTYIQGGDMDGVMRTYNAAVMNGIDAEDCLKAAIATVKATQRKELADGITDLQSAMNAYDAEKDTAEKKRLRRKIFAYLAEQDYKAFTRDEARSQVDAFLNGDQPKENDNDINKYVRLATSADVRDEYRLEKVQKMAKKYVDEVKTAEGDRQRKLEENYGNWLDMYDIITKANREIGRLKRRLGKEGEDDAAIMDEIRTIRRETQKEVDEIQAP